MRVHHLNCGTMCPLAGGAIGSGTGLRRGLMVCHCLVVETPRDGLVLVDTGWGTSECRDPSLLPGYFRRLTGPTLSLAETAVEQLPRLGFTAADVRHVVVTHLDLDHAGGLVDFPRATVHLHQRELDAATARATRAERKRYLPHQWAHQPRWSPVAETGDTWRDLPAARKLPGLDADIALLPMHGHTRGHSAIVVGTGDGWLVHAGDAYFHHDELTTGRAPFGLRAFQSIIQVDGRARHASQAALRRLKAAHADVTIISAHDPAELSPFQTA
ncbi:MAG: MBL fold metallo-hydrolase [Myxococcales bacterium]|nr:MBL fold metallo-hydrolase [Myxococcales bacterium]